MQREWLFGAAVLAVLAVTVVGAALVPGAVADRSDEVVEGDLRLQEITISDGRVGGETLELQTDVRLAHRRGVSENVSVEFRAIGLDSGLVADSRTVDVGRVSGDREVSVVETLTVERGGGYRVEATVYRDGQRRATGAKEVRGTGGLTPDYADSPVEFHRFARSDLPVIEYSIAEASGNRSTLSVSTYLTNTGDAPTEGMHLVVKARQVESGIVADEQAVRVDGIDPGETVTPETSLTVPSQYNYYLDAILWVDGVVVDTTRAGASLDPTERVPANTTERDVGLQVSDFEGGAGDGRPTAQPEATGTPAAAEGPGFGVVAAVLALAAVLVLALARRNGEHP
jgi:hypothetical protein